MEGGAKKKKHLSKSFLTWFKSQKKARKMSTNELIKFLVVRPDRRRKRRPKTADATVTGSKTIASVKERNSRPSKFQDAILHSSARSGASLSFPTLTPVTQTEAAAAPPGTAVVLRIADKANGGEERMVEYKPGTRKQVGDRYYVLPAGSEDRRENQIEITRGMHDAANHMGRITTELKDTKEEKEKVSKAKEELEAKAQERRKADREARILALWKKHAPYDKKLQAGVPAAAGKSHENILKYWYDKKDKKVVHAYDKAVAEADKEMSGSGSKKIQPLMTSEINRMLSKVPGFMGAIARDEPMKVPANPPQTGVSWVVNMDTMSQPGSHWVGVVIQPKAVCYFDSFGKDPPADLEQKLIAEGKKLWPENPKTFKVNRVPHQDARTATCGYHAMKFINDMCVKGKSFPAATGYDNLKGQVHKDEKAIREFANKFPKFTQIGEGLFSLDDKAPNAVRKMIDRFGEWKIVWLRVVRSPVASAIGSILNGLTLGRYQEVLRSKGYDKMFHLALFARIEPPDATDGSREKVIRIEKNAIVGITETNIPLGKGVESMPAPAGRHQVKDLFGRQKDPGFWLYDPFKNNCQDFILKLLQTIGSATPQATAFIKQDAVDIGKKLGWFTTTVAKAVTDIGGRVEGAIDKVRDATGLGVVKQEGWNLRMVPTFVHDETGMTHPYHPLVGLGSPISMHTKPMYSTMPPPRKTVAVLA